MRTFVTGSSAALFKTNLSIPEQVLTETDDLSFDQAVEIATSLEGAKLNAQLMKSPIASNGTLAHRVGNRSSKPQNHSVVSFYRCGGPHLANKCLFIKEKCDSCGKTGHISKVCHSKPSVIPHPTQARSKGRSPKVANVVEETSTSSLDDLHQGFRVYSIPSRVAPLRVTITAYGRKLNMELDTGSAVSVISGDTFKSLFHDEVKLKPTTISLCSYSGHLLTILGIANLKMTYKSQQFTLPIVVVKGQGPTLSGRNWLQSIQLDWQFIKTVYYKSSVEKVKKHSCLFRSELGTIQGMKTKIFVPPETQPRFFKLRSLPYTLKSQVEAELDRLVQAKVITHTQFSDWAAPIIPVIKTDGNIRVCGDYKKLSMLLQSQRSTHYPEWTIFSLPYQAYTEFMKRCPYTLHKYFCHACNLIVISNLFCQHFLNFPNPK